MKRPNEKSSKGLKTSIPDNSTAMNNNTKTGYKISKSGTKRKMNADKKHSLEVCDSMAASKFCGCQSPPLINWMIGVASIDPLAWKKISKLILVLTFKSFLKIGYELPLEWQSRQG